MRYSSFVGGRWFVIVFLCLMPLYAQGDKQKSTPLVEENATQIEHEIPAVRKSIIGGVERVRVIPGNIILKARIDTGATTSSLGVDSYEITNEDGKEWVEMTLEGFKSKHEVIKYILIKQHDAESLKRPVIRLRLILGDISESVNVTLADRSNFTYKLLIGRNFLYDHFLVDVSLKYTTTPILYEEQ
jgi:hypothetical protein